MSSKIREKMEISHETPEKYKMLYQKHSKTQALDYLHKMGNPKNKHISHAPSGGMRDM